MQFPLIHGKKLQNMIQKLAAIIKGFRCNICNVASIAQNKSCRE